MGFSLLLDFIQLFVWTSIRSLAVFLRNIKWNMNGTSAQLKKMRNHTKKCRDCKCCVHIRRIWARQNIDPIVLRASEAWFITYHHRFAPAEYVLRDNVTLYGITDTEAWFIETDSDVDVLKSDNSGFVKISQFKLASKFIVMPLRCFHDLSERLSSPKERLVLLGNTARCGGTLMTQIFEETGRCVTWSEPDAMNATAFLPKTEQGDATLRSIVKLLCKPHRRPANLYVLKIALPFSGMPRLHRLFPEAKMLFMYRDPTATLRSFVNLMSATSILKFGYAIPMLSVHLTRLMLEKLGFDPKDLKLSKRFESRVQYMALLLGKVYKDYLTFRQNGLPIVAIKYEDILEHSMNSCRTIFEYVGLEFDDVAQRAVTVAFGRDSQRNTPLSREAFRKIQPVEEIDDHKLVQIDEMFVKLGLQPVTERGITVPGTISAITRSGDY